MAATGGVLDPAAWSMTWSHVPSAFRRTSWAPLPETTSLPLTLRELPGITPKVMAERPDAPGDGGLVARSRLSRFPRGFFYDVTRRGRAIILILDQIETRAAQG
ncbi:hypothetical protein [Mesorhizobium sp. L-8-3]|uniref:hypothetical protein n=1 Tax=Mesorhizobium sp. L-8-3 TaxID=2744522 RepID=UPI001925C75C|nr:hypothetical protein [Mesorhizobium sp. L-8-3]BCH22150.1 hypothetical protein MesoLjLb_19350 [Mesorhizobium sp. L-8-3]